MNTCLMITIRMSTLTALLCLSLAACGGGGSDILEPASPATGSGGGPAVAPPAAAANPGARPFTLSAGELTVISRPFGTAHDGLPAGVPLDYDWSRFSKPDRVNAIPTGYTAFTGWGQAFWLTGARPSTQLLEVRDNQTFLCTMSGPAGSTRTWSRVQEGDIEGAAFRSDFAGNQNVPAQTTLIAPAHHRIGFPAGQAYHFWPKQGRISLTGDALCGVVVVFQARAVGLDGNVLALDAPVTMVIGGGADYWLNLTAPWRDYQTNIGVGVGQLRHVTSQWRWFGMGTAGATDQQALLLQGYIDRTRQ